MIHWRTTEGDAWARSTHRNRKHGPECNDTVGELFDVLFARARATAAGFGCMNEIDLAEVFKVRICVMKSIPKFVRTSWGSDVELQKIQRRSETTALWKHGDRTCSFLCPRYCSDHPKGVCRSACVSTQVSGSFFCVCRWKVCCRASVQVEGIERTLKLLTDENRRPRSVRDR